MARNSLIKSLPLLLVAIVSPMRSSGQGFQFYAVAPCRAVDTRIGFGGRVPGATLRNFQIKSVCGVPSNAQAVSLNVTAVLPTHGGYLLLWPAGGTYPGAVSNINFDDGEIAIANGAFVPLGTGN